MARPAHRPFIQRHRSGRGTSANEAGRYEGRTAEAFDDGWTAEPDAPLRTTVSEEPARTIITRNDSPYVGFDRSINPYRGCEHGCSYCFARPTHAYLGLSPGLDFETRLFAKPNAAALLRRELSNPRYDVRPIAIGTNTDPYQPIERTHRVMREVLEVLAEHRHPVSILTKSDLVLRDLDLIAPMAKQGLARVMLSITTLDGALARAMEPRAPRPDLRLEAVRVLSMAGVPTGTVHGPMIPGLSDHELERLMDAAAVRGATYAAYTVLRLPQEVASLFEEWLETHAPDAKARVLRHLRDMNGGRTYDAAWARAEEPRTIYAQLIRQRFAQAYKRLGFTEMPSLDCTQFRVPGRAEQPELFASA